MAKKGQTFYSYTEEFKLSAVKAYLEGGASYKVVAEREGIRNCSQLKVWVKKWKNGESLGKSKGEVNPLKGTSTYVVWKCRRRARLPESAGGLFKKAVSKSSKGEALSQQVNYEIVEELRGSHGITRLLTIAGIPRASYYKWRATKPEREARRDKTTK